VTSEPAVAATATPSDALDPTRVEQALATLREQSSQPREWAQGWWDAWNARDVEAILALTHDDITFLDPGMLGEPLRGRTQFRGFVEMFFQIYPDGTIERSDWPIYVAVDGIGLAIPWRVRCTFSGDMSGGPCPLALAPTGRPVDVEGVDLYVFKDGLLHRWSRIANGVEIMAQIHGVNLLRVGPILIRIQRALVAPLLRRTSRGRRARRQEPAERS
jgi:hypothetical protein